jgi:hypothetical protein
MKIKKYLLVTLLLSSFGAGPTTAQATRLATCWTSKMAHTSLLSTNSTPEDDCDFWLQVWGKATGEYGAELYLLLGIEESKQPGPLT